MTAAEVLRGARDALAAAVSRAAVTPGPGAPQTSLTEGVSHGQRRDAHKGTEDSVMYVRGPGLLFHGSRLDADAVHAARGPSDGKTASSASCVSVSGRLPGSPACTSRITNPELIPLKFP